MASKRNVSDHLRTLSCLMFWLALGCETAATESGVTAWLHVAGPAVQFEPGPLPPGDGGPRVTGLISLQNFVYPGQLGKPLGGSLAPGATAVALALEGDAGYWIVPAGVPDVIAPEQPTFSVLLSFSPRLPPRPRVLLVQARDAAGVAGAPLQQQLDVIPDAALPDGVLVITLRWDRQADLDLHVETPSGIEIWSGMKIGYNPPLGASDPVARDRAGRLDFDSNAACVIDGRQQENVLFAGPEAPPRGRYRVRIDTPSLCQQESARWSVQVRRSGSLYAQARGQSTEAATRGSHSLGSGVLALEFNVP